MNDIDIDKALPAVVESMAKDLIGDSPDSKQQLFYIYYMFLGSITEASNLAGYSYNHARKLAKRFRGSRVLQQQIMSKAEALPSKYKTFVKLLTPRIAMLDLATVKQYESNPEYLVKHPKALRDLKQIGSLIDPEVTAGQTINIDKMQVIIQQALGEPDSAG